MRDGEALVLVDQFSEVALVLLLLLNALVQLFKLAQEYLFLLMLLLGAHEEFFVVALPLNLLLV